MTFQGDCGPGQDVSSSGRPGMVHATVALLLLFRLIFSADMVNVPWGWRFLSRR